MALNALYSFCAAFEIYLLCSIVLFMVYAVVIFLLLKHFYNPCGALPLYNISLSLYLILYHLQVYLAKMKINLAERKLNLAQIKFNLAQMKLNLAQMKINLAQMKFKLTLMKLYPVSYLLFSYFGIILKNFLF